MSLFIFQSSRKPPFSPTSKSKLMQINPFTDNFRAKVIYRWEKITVFISTDAQIEKDLLQVTQVNSKTDENLSFLFYTARKISQRPISIIVFFPRQVIHCLYKLYDLPEVFTGTTNFKIPYMKFFSLYNTFNMNKCTKFLLWVISHCLPNVLQCDHIVFYTSKSLY